MPHFSLQTSCSRLFHFDIGNERERATATVLREPVRAREMSLAPFHSTPIRSICFGSQQTTKNERADISFSRTHSHSRTLVRSLSDSQLQSS